jgi:hypothetical protein
MLVVHFTSQNCIAADRQKNDSLVNFFVSDREMPAHFSFNIITFEFVFIFVR